MWIVFVELWLDLGIDLGLGFPDGAVEGVSGEVESSIFFHALKVFVCVSGKKGFEN